MITEKNRVWILSLGISFKKGTGGEREQGTGKKGIGEWGIGKKGMGNWGIGNWELGWDFNQLKPVDFRHDYDKYSD
jgi:hypothetical protein